MDRKTKVDNSKIRLIAYNTSKIRKL